MPKSPHPPPTPMMAQYHALKEQAPDCLLFYRMGDFFELFFDDARAAAATLDIALTSRGEHMGVAVPMCGVPVHAAEGYLARLIKAGHKVAIAEQTETPAAAKARAKASGGKSIVARDIIRFVTAGTLTEEVLLDARRDNVLVAIADVQGQCGLALCDISTGAFEVMALEHSALAGELARINPSETIVAEGMTAPPQGSETRPREDFDSSNAAHMLQQHFGWVLPEMARAELAAAGGLLSYLRHVTRDNLPFLQAPVQRRTGGYMAIDAATRDSLEISQSVSGNRAHSLIGCIDRSVTGAGARLLANDLNAPLLDKAAIEARLALVAWFHTDQLRRETVRDALKAIADIARALGRIVAGRGSPRDMGQIRDGLIAAADLRDYLADIPEHPALLDTLMPKLGGHSALTSLLASALVASPPTERQSGGYIAPGYDAALDVLRSTSGDARRAIAALEARYREATGVASLKIRHNAVLGYFVEVPAKHGDALMREDSGFTHRQTMAGAVRFNSPDLHAEAMRIVEAGAHALAAEDAHFEELTAAILDCKQAIADTAAALARIDVAAAHAARAQEGGWTAPNLTHDAVLEITGGRHPVVEAALAKSGDAFVSNDCSLAPESRLWLISGPNMGGKSTFLRQNALIILLAQAGSFVPAAHARIGITDRLFSRVGASDNLARGQSTFMVEMVETAAILAEATPQSFVILDEIGRGTSTYDGLALAWAVVEAVHEMNRCRCLFATHYHELTRLAETLDALSLHHVRAREWQGELVLLHELARGPADRSYGIAVAKLAGIAPRVLARAKAVLAKLEAGRAATGGLAAGLDDLPLFAAALAEAKPPADPLRDQLAALDVDALSPREALEQLYALKHLLSVAQKPH